jgi:5-methyltetrahydropteroyltriglutamate--homocysteine methyltransferase
MPRLTAGPFRYKQYADSYLEVAMRYAHVPVKQAAISPSALSLMYPADEIPGYSREQFIDDLLGEHETEVRNCLRKGAHKVQIDFTEGRLAVKIDPTGRLLHSFIDLNNLALARFSEEERRRIGVHTCPGSDIDSRHSGEVDYADLLPSLFQLKVGNLYIIALAGEKDRIRVLKIIREYLKPGQMVFVGVIRAQQWGQDVKIIALTGWGQDGDKERSREAGCDGHLVKPVSLPDLEALLEASRDRG